MFEQFSESWETFFSAPEAERVVKEEDMDNEFWGILEAVGICGARAEMVHAAAKLEGIYRHGR